MVLDAHIDGFAQVFGVGQGGDGGDFFGHSQAAAHRKPGVRMNCGLDVGLPIARPRSETDGIDLVPGDEYVVGLCAPALNCCVCG